MVIKVNMLIIIIFINLYRLDYEYDKLSLIEVFVNLWKNFLFSVKIKM
jgi:hypothetical protein